jgi:hypothetical protein
MQRDFLYNVEDTENNTEYTVAMMEDINIESQYMSYDIYDDDGEIVKDEDTIIRIMSAIESTRN